MNPVVGLDVAKGESQVQAFSDKSKPFGKSYVLIGFLKEMEGMTGQMPMVILESTGHYHSPVIQYLEEHEVLSSCLILLFLIRRRGSVCER